MVTERDIDGALLALRQAITNNDEALIAECVATLAGGVLKNLSRIADALEMIATKGATP